MNEFMIVVNYFDESSPQIKRTVYQILEQNHTSGLEAFNSLKNQLLNDDLSPKSILGSGLVF